MIKKIRYILYLLVFGTVYGQSLQLKFSDVEKSGFGEIHEQLIGVGNSGYDIIRLKYSTFGEAIIFSDHFDQGTLMRKYTLEIYKKDLYRHGIVKFKTEFE